MRAAHIPPHDSVAALRALHVWQARHDPKAPDEAEQQLSVVLEFDHRVDAPDEAETTTVPVAPEAETRTRTANPYADDGATGSSGPEAAGFGDSGFVAVDRRDEAES